MPPAIQISSSSTVHAVINLAVGASGSARHAAAGWSRRGASFSASADDVTWPSSTPVDPPIAYTVFPTEATAKPWRALPMSGSSIHVAVVRSSAATLLRTCPADLPPTATNRASLTATPKSLRPCGSPGMVAHLSVAGSYVSTVVRSEVPFVPPTVYTSLPSDAAANICRGVGMGAPGFQEVPSKISVVFSSAPSASTPPVTMMRSPTTAAAAAARGCIRGGNSVQRLLTTLHTWSVATFGLVPSVRQPPSTTGVSCHVTDIACCTPTGRSSPPFQLSMAGS